ncbi:hypothetical protein BLEM_1311 [Bifidobacterium lemurum]|uniref:Haloacid dehalogenase-like hydrolase n=1 Tax=Bifidobacterium lemurum TaxID=1603886 RepID=A0A261FRG7_9BIFI|nr:HAD family hydrolase [Bifidobacterium lemurum]OZG61774.1 hypothetical protein BLEM_1311 [Bifidobacterium lemurum]QOL34928.1 haloacid dehalogenase-like hydrolase [Bifidobacterium lemurum]
MANIIAVVWDFDKTLVDGYMQDPIFEAYDVDAQTFWHEVNALPEKYMREQDVRVNSDTIYLNQFIKEAQSGGRFQGLNNEQLKDFGSKLKFYPGVPDIFKETTQLVEGNEAFSERDIKVEHYIVSTGMAPVIKGSIVAQYVRGIWGCELIEKKNEDGTRVISELGYTIDNTSKTRALFEINKGVPVESGIDVNAKMPESMRRVRFENMIYIADGPSDIPAFSVVNRYGGSTFAVYPKKDDKAFAQVEQMRESGRIDMYAEADYREGTTANMWIKHKIEELAKRIVDQEKAKVASSVQGAPKHLV